MRESSHETGQGITEGHDATIKTEDLLREIQTVEHLGEGLPNGQNGGGGR